METPVTRAEFELRFHHLLVNMKSGKLQYPSNVAESLFRLKLLPNGRLDFLSVDELARVQVNTMHTVIAMQEAFQGQDEQGPSSGE
ncbi:hypothetical protein CER19_25340 [Pseudomonas sp. GL93]|uniref:AVAST type 1 anti-phage system protein Avs1c n=1 Tax=Pseudomonas sp. GL93 TaxID=2014741 RepID=UPI000E3195CF|nr:hypothetical protein CER19_25340 [Pseudomonas sp. GL93]